MKALERFMFRGMEVKSRCSPLQAETPLLRIGFTKVPAMSSASIIQITRSFSPKLPLLEQHNSPAETLADLAKHLPGFAAWVEDSAGHV